MVTEPNLLQVFISIYHQNQLKSKLLWKVYKKKYLANLAT